MATMLFYNFKGGVGKTATSSIFAHQMVKKGKKVLLIDLDPQENATQVIKEAYEIERPKLNLFEALSRNSIKKSIVKVDDNFDLIPGDWEITLFQELYTKNTKHDSRLTLDKFIKPIHDDYDFIVLDVPPTNLQIVENAILAADVITLILQTQKSAYSGVLKTINIMSDIRNEYDEAHFTFVGIILYMYKSDGFVDNNITNTARELFEDGVFSNEIYQRERVKMWFFHGITNRPYDSHDVKTHEMYTLVFKELFLRAKRLGVDINE